MSKFDDKIKIRQSILKRTFSVTVAVLNVVLLVIAALLYGRYVSMYQQGLREENLGNIANMNKASALNATALVDSWSIKLKDVIGYIEKNELSPDEALLVIEQSNSTADRQFELIGSDYEGFLAARDENGEFIPVSYSSSFYADLQKSLDDSMDSANEDVCFAPEFTDSISAYKCFAIYRHLTLSTKENQDETYALLLCAKSKDVLAVFNNQKDFKGQSAILMDSKGGYIVGSSDFKSDNFFHYLYVYNDLSLDERTAIEIEVAEKEKGELYYKNALGEDCVFRYEKTATNDWYCVTCVPIDSFRNPALKADYAVFAVLALTVLFIMDAIWLQNINRRLRVSAIREKEASEAKTDFLSRMSHDIRTPINGIIGLTTLALNENVSQTVRDYLDNIKVSGQFLTGLVNDILDLSKVESGKVELKPEPYSSRDLYKYAKAVATPLCKEKGLELRMQKADENTPVLLDRLRFNQIMYNLLSNAVKYTPEGGFVELTWKREELSEGQVALDISVRDNGVGMSEEFQKHMFESFTQEKTQTAKTGTGLGLAIVSSLIKLMNGSISVQSKQGVGSTFTVHLEAPVCKEAQTVTKERVSVKLEGLRVLLCEDNAINVLVAQKTLEVWGINVDVATNGRLATKMFSESEPYTYDAVLMDVMMPEMNGLDATRAIREMDRPDAAAVPILAMTANAYESDVKDCIDAGMNAHMSKPIDHDMLYDTLSDLIGKAKNTKN